jgi:hypothetical protein
MRCQQGRGTPESLQSTPPSDALQTRQLGGNVSEDLKVRPAEVEPNDDADRSRDWARIAKWVLVGLAVILVFSFVVPPHIEGGIHTWYDNWQQTRYLKSHGVVVTPAATVPGPVNGLATDAAGNIYALSGTQRALIVVHPDGSQTSVHIPDVKANGITYRGWLTENVYRHAIVTLPNGTTFIADEYRGGIIRVDPDGTVNMNWVSPAALGGTMYMHASLYGDAHGNLYEFGLKGITHIAPDGTVTQGWVSWQQLKYAYSLAVRPEGTVFIFGLIANGPAGRTDIFQVQSDRSVVRISSVTQTVQPMHAPPSIGLGPIVDAAASSNDLWVLESSAVAKLLPDAHYNSWWLTDSHGQYAGTTGPFALGRNETAYAVLDTNNLELELQNPNKVQPTSIVRFKLPTS